MTVYTKILTRPIVDALNSNIEVAKELLRIDRAKLLKLLAHAKPKLPVTPDNVILFWNASGPQHQCLQSLTPVIVNDAAVGVSVGFASAVR